MLTASVSFSSIWDYAAQLMAHTEVDYLCRVMIGGLLGLCIGIERSRRQKDAGMGTHFIVACAASLLTCISLWFKTDAGDLGDGARIAAQIVSGVGFLGAGMIFFRRESMRGLTTAAGIWATAAIGMCTATKMYVLAAGTTAAIIFLQNIIHSRSIKKNSSHLLLVKLVYTDEIKEKMQSFFGFHNFHRFKITSVSEKAAGETGGSDSRSPVAVATKQINVEAVIYSTKNCGVEAITDFICQNPEIKSIERLEDL